MNTHSFANEQKLKAFTQALEDDYAFAHINTRNSKLLKLPEQLLNQPSVTLKLSFFFHGAVSLERQGVVANLRFGEDYFECIIPWESVWGLTNTKGENLTWPDAIPQELLEPENNNTHEAKSKGKNLAKPSPAKKSSKAPATKKRPQLKRIK
jgi:hypothetical protein